ncbi:hypothetical protein XU18_3801 [Perkinsela sp. CCAP 1560/4]|nr:hypothetical protein XU18_3801 [Perkinsela sp. CCAP 1560/4]|eukprot:KNH05073.1 hypothetical protein XU18_3801 [Perkinsela sp. CCAP 1560/4]
MELIVIRLKKNTFIGPWKFDTEYGRAGCTYNSIVDVALVSPPGGFGFPIATSGGLLNLPMMGTCPTHHEEAFYRVSEMIATYRECSHRGRQTIQVKGSFEIHRVGQRTYFDENEYAGENQEVLLSPIRLKNYIE